MNPWWMEVAQTVREEFSDISDPSQVTRVCVRLLVAVVLGGLLGYERESHGNSAGFRTHMLVALGAALFVLVPLEAGITPADLSRVLQGVITGVGFLGAGAIIKLSQEQEIKGLTTAASVWLTAAIGVAAGMGRESTAILSTLFALFILSVLRRVMSNKDKETSTRIEKAS
ncbi:MAG: MgtC/SapB family protein [Herminiimonas sp.]|uniref:MgtC/SapB family protein n=1 Tax=Herminiimonas sp. TaxID=1926289 RepID=UPI00271EB23E|nr:MgtC/SapB family protein [Herminiimonas sp.]MDO9419261.1 MgtC/SapB family protein [Herminiimonas sp.]